MAIFKPNRNGTKVQVKLFENEIKGKLTADYVKFLLLANGGNLLNAKFEINDCVDYSNDNYRMIAEVNTGGEISEFLGLSKNTFSNLSNIYQNCHQLTNLTEVNEYVPAMDWDFLPIAFHNEQSCIVLSLKVHEVGAVRYWWPERSIGGFESINTTPKIANSFTELLSILIEQNGGYIENLSEVYEEIKKYNLESCRRR
jgi:SMI1-KNR4 cell-wall